MKTVFAFLIVLSYSLAALASPFGPEAAGIQKKAFLLIRDSAISTSEKKMLDIVIEGPAAKTLYDSMMSEAKPHNGLFLKENSDFSMSCQIDAGKYSCDLFINNNSSKTE